MRGYEAYPEYQDSGVEWLANIPKGWRVQKQKYIFESLESGVSVNAADVSTQDGQIGVLKTSCVYTRKFRPEENKTVVPEELGRVRCPVKNQSIIISRMNTPDLVGAAAYVEHEYDNLYLPDRLWQTTVCDNVKYSTKYLWYNMFLKGFRDQIASAAEGASSSMQNIAQDDFLAINVCVPSGQEQYGIANFLDHETVKIDTLIKKQQQLIKLLKEKRQAVISHAVTKGLNPDAPMKDSGVEWLGEVPAGWDVSRMKYSLVSIEQGWSPQCASHPAAENEFGVLKVGCVNHGIFNERENKALPKSLRPLTQYSLRKDDLLISRANTRDLVGSAAVVPHDNDNLLLCDKLYRLRFKKGVDPHYVAYYMTVPLVRQQIELGASGASHSMQNIGQSTILELPIPQISNEESVKILTFLKHEINSFDECELKIVSQLKLLEERRTALISAAVTGKIDVRNWQPPETTSTTSTDA